MKLSEAREDMAASSPASASASASAAAARAADEPALSVPAFNGTATATPQKTAAFDMPKPSLRGLNKPKCVKCGNVARSRCPFQCCKNCCYTAQNPCHIHVLIVKQNSTLPEKAPATPSPSVEHTPKDNGSTNGASSWRLNSLRQLSSRYLDSLRARKHPGKKDTGLVNKWKSMKLREHLEGNVEAESEAFDRYMQNVYLLEEVFSESTTDISNVKLGLKSNTEKSAASKKRLSKVIDQKLKELSCTTYEGTEFLEVVRRRSERNSTTNDLITRLSRVRGEDDLKPCIEVGTRLFGDISEGQSYCFSNKPCIGVQVDQEEITKIDAELSSVNQVVQL